LKFKKVICLFASLSLICSIAPISSAVSSNGIKASIKITTNPSKSHKRSNKTKHKKITNHRESEKERKRRLEKDGARNPLEQIELHRDALIDPKTPLDRYYSIKKQSEYEYIRDFFNLDNYHKLCFQFVFDKCGLPPVALQIASQLLLDEILGNYKSWYVSKSCDGLLAAEAIPIGGFHIDYPIYIKDEKSRNKLQEILNKRYYKKFPNIISTIINRLKNDDNYLKKTVDKMIKKLKSCVDYLDKKIDELSQNTQEYYVKFGREFLKSSLSAAINKLKDDKEAFSLAKKIEDKLKDPEEIEQIGISRSKDIIENLNNIRKNFISSIEALEEKNPNSYNECLSKIINIDENTKYGLKDVVIVCLEKMRKKPTRPVPYNNTEERYVLKLNIKYEGF